MSIKFPALIVALSALLQLTFFPPALHAEPAATGSASAPHKHALLVAVSKYHHKDSDPCDLNTKPDIEHIKAALETRFGFSNKDIVVLETAKATTHDAILSALQNLIDQTQPGDVVYFHFSGHGSEVPDPTHHKLTGVSQTIVPSDYDASNKPTCNEITDLELKEKISQLQNKEPLLATLTFDCCHSGGNTRGRHLCRGFEYPGTLQTRSLSAPVPEKIAESKSKNLVVIAACRPDQKAWETDGDGQSMGLFSYCLSKAFSNAKDDTTYRDIFEQVKAAMAPEESDEIQSPQMDGQVDNVLMSAVALPAQPAIIVERKPDGQLILDAGQLQNMTEGSRFTVYPIEAKELKAANAIGEVTIDKTNMTTADVSVDQDPKGLLAKLQRAKVTELEHCYPGNSQLQVVLEGLDHRTSDLIEYGLKDSKAVAIHRPGDAGAAQWDVKLTTGKNGQVSVVRADSHEIASFPIKTGDQVEPLKQQLESEVKWKYLKVLNNSNPYSPLTVSMRAVPVKVVERDHDKLPTKVDPEETADSAVIPANQVMTDQDYFMLEVKNDGTQPAFINVLDLQPGGTIDILYPDPNIKVSYSLPADGKWHRIPKPYIFQVSEPFGVDVIKVVATLQPTDFSPLVSTTRGARDVSALNPIEKLFTLASEPATRGVKRPSFRVAPEGWAAADVVLETKKGVQKTTQNQ